MGLLHKYADDFKLLLESGFIAAHQADEDSANKLFKASLALDPKNTLPKVGQGYVHFLKLELKQAIDCFETVLKQDHQNYMAQALLGLSTAFTTKNIEHGEKLLREAAEKAPEPSVKTMARTALEFIDKFIKKTPTPMEGKPDTKKKGKK